MATQLRVGIHCVSSHIRQYDTRGRGIKSMPPPNKISKKFEFDILWGNLYERIFLFVFLISSFECDLGVMGGGC